jgi:UDP-4-amino-4,6-dideoxy-N-acetyl-beta-L-altrosamine transaminase
MIPYGKQEITQADIDAVVNVLKSDFLTQGPKVPEFEYEVSKLVGASHAVATNSSTSALHIACLALGVSTGDRVWTVPNTFVASANCALYCDADVDFVDIDHETWNISIEHLNKKLISAEQNNSLPKVLVTVHFAGQPTEQEKIRELSHQYGFKILEDASHAIGASRNAEFVGSCRWSDITVFSFHPVKIITTGEGGMALTNDEKLAEHMALLRSHGITRNIDMFKDTSTEHGSWYYEQQMLGFNYRMTDLQAALGISQLERLEVTIKRRNMLACRYTEMLTSLPLQLPIVQKENMSAFHLYVVRLQASYKDKTYKQVYETLREEGIGVNKHYIPVYMQPYYRDMGFTTGYCPTAEAYSESAITLPLFPSLTDQQQDQVVVLSNVLAKT